MTPEDANRLAKLIVDDLFVNGNNEQGQRLVITDDGPPKRDLGGWSRVAVYHRVAKLCRTCGHAASVHLYGHCFECGRASCWS
jgi:hypothetical protein